MRIALTGHRPQRLFGEDLDNEKWQAIKHWIQKILLENHCTVAYSGMASGSDMLFALAVKELKEKGNNINLKLVFPCKNYGSKSKDKKYLQWRREIIKAADEEIYIHEEWCKTADDDRDKYMVKHCNALIAIFDGNNVGGVYNTIQYAKKDNKSIIYCPDKLVKKRNEIKVLVFNNYGANVVPSALKKVMDKNTFPKNRIGKVIEYIESNYKPISNEDGIVQYNVKTNKEQSYFCIKTVDISRPWKIEEYDGAEYIQYLDIVTIDKELNYCNYKE